MQLLAMLESFGCGRHQESGDLFILNVRLGVHHDDISRAAISDPQFGAGEPVAAFDFFAASAHRHHVGTGVGFADGQCANELAGGQFGQEFGLLLLGSVERDLVHAEVGMGDIAEADGA